MKVDELKVELEKNRDFKVRKESRLVREVDESNRQSCAEYCGWNNSTSTYRILFSSKVEVDRLGKFTDLT